MYIDPVLLPRALLYLSGALALVGLSLAVRAAPWGALYRVPQRIHLCAGGAVCCLLLWLLNIRFDQGLTVHLMGVTTLAMVLGVSLALLAGTATLLAFALFKGLGFWGLPLAWLLTVLVPVLVTHL
ncbi:MAG: hypothetical protein KDI01_05425, partial [Halioglobus sp.]|nr:hypothetical protein [Halioglobus sp.]